MYYYAGAPNWVFSMFSFIAFLISFIPLPWHLEAWNVGTCMYMLWSGLANLVLFIDSIIWNGNMIDWSPTWCDISTHFLNGFNLAIPACSLCINRRLYHIASVRTVTKTRKEQRKAIAIDLCIALGIPVLQIPLQYVVQGHRYNIYEDIGCLGETFETPVAVVLYHLPPVLIGLVSAVYCVLSIKNFYHSRAQFKEFLASSNSNLNLNRYVRLMCLASTDLFLTVPLGIYTLWVNAKVFGIARWISWDDTHSNFSRVVQFPGFIWRSDPFSAASLESARWLTVGCAIMFFAYFGFADEAIKNYRFAFFSVAKRVGYSTATESSSGGAWTSAGSKKPNMSSTGRNGATLPVFIRKEATAKRHSFDSFSDMSASYGALDYDGTGSVDKEKSLGALSLGDMAGILPDYKESGYSGPESPSSSSGSSAGTRTRSHTPVEEIEVSSLHPASTHIVPSPPEPAHNPRDRDALPVLPPHQMV